MATRVVGNGVLEIDGQRATDWATAKELLAAKGIYGAELVEWVKKNPNKAAALGAGINDRGNISTGQNAMRWDYSANASSGEFVNRPGVSSGQIDPATGALLSQEELAYRVNAAQDKANQDAVIQDKANQDAYADAYEKIVGPIINDITESGKARNEALARGAASQIVNALVNLGYASGMNLEQIIASLPVAIRDILNAPMDDPNTPEIEGSGFGGAQSIMQMMVDGGELSLLAELDRAIGNLEKNKGYILENQTEQVRRLDRDMGLGTDRLETLNERALRAIADQSAARGLARSGIKNRFNREQGEDHAYALSEFQNAINDAMFDVRHQTKRAISQIDYQVGELGIDKRQAVRDTVQNLSLLASGMAAEMAQTGMDVNQQLLDVRGAYDPNSLGLSYPSPVEAPTITPEDLGLAGRASTYAEGVGAPAPSGAIGGVGTTAPTSFKYFNTVYGDGGEDPAQFKRTWQTKQKQRKPENQIKWDDFLETNPTIAGFF